MSNHGQGQGNGPPPGHGPGSIPGQAVAARAKLQGRHANLEAPKLQLSDHEAALLQARSTPLSSYDRVLPARVVELLSDRLEAL